MTFFAPQAMCSASPARFLVLGGVLALFQGTGGLHGDVDAKAGPFPFAGLAAGDFDMTAVDDDAVFVMAHRALESVVDGIVFEEMGQRSVVRAGIDHHGEFVALSHKADKITTDAAEAVHPQRYGHVALLHAREMENAASPVEAA